MKNNFFLYIFITALLLSCSSEDNKHISKNEIGQMQVEFTILKGETIDRKITVPGTVLPFEMVELYSEVSGRLEKILFKEGDKVKKGQALIIIDTDILEAQRNQIAVDLELAEKEKQRKKNLYENKAGSFEEFEQAEARVNALNAELHLYDVQIEKGTIRAPFSGQIGLRQVSEGAYITPSTNITTLVQNHRVKIEFSVAQRYAGLVQRNQTIKLNSLGDNIVHTAEIYAFEPTIEANTRMLKVRAEMDADKHVFPGSFVQVDYNLGTIENSILIPSSAMTPVLNGQKIWIMENGKAKPVLVEPGIRTSDRVQIDGDINIGDTLITTGLLGLREGIPVNGKIKKL